MTERLNVVVLDAIFLDAVKTVREQFPGMEIHVAAGDIDRNALIAQADVVVVQQDGVKSDLLDAATGLRLLLKMGRVYDNIDVDAARKRDVPMAFVPRKGPNCVAELDMTLILALSKDLIRSHSNVADGAYRRRGLRPALTTQENFCFHWMKQVRVHEVRQKTLGIVGMGEIGTELARRANGMDMTVLYYDAVRRSAELEERYKVLYSDLRTLLEVSDYVCLVVPHLPSTEHMIGAEELSLIGPSGYLVSACRGRVVDEDALIDALRDGTIAGAGLDVFTYEPLPADSPLCTLDNVILTPHIGGGSGTTEALELGEALAEVESIMAGNPAKNPF